MVIYGLDKRTNHTPVIDMERFRGIGREGEGVLCYGSYKAKTPPCKAGIQLTTPPLTTLDDPVGYSTPSRPF